MVLGRHDGPSQETVRDEGTEVCGGWHVRAIPALWGEYKAKRSEGDSGGEGG